MNTLTILVVVQVLIAIAMIGLILVQRGPGATAGAAFGGGASGTVFGSRGAGSFLTRTTAILATGFFIVSMAMGVIASDQARQQTAASADLGVMDQVSTPDQAAPAGDDLPTMSDDIPDDVPMMPVDAPDDAATQQDAAEDDNGNGQ